MAMTVAGIIKFCLVSSCKISHFGIKPDRGGRPPRERRVMRAIMESKGDFDEDEEIELILVELSVLNRRKVVEVIII